MRKSITGFTIVELLIVIVVIAILAAISVVAYTGIQQRATNSSIIASANQTVKLIQAYIAENGNYPFTGSVVCVVPGSSTCTSGDVSRSSNATLNNNLATIGTLPTSVPNARPGYTGIVYDHTNSTSSRTLNGEMLQLVIIYSLIGTNQHCGVSNAVTGETWNTFTHSTTGYYSSSGGYTLCVVAVPEP